MRSLVLISVDGLTSGLYSSPSSPCQGLRRLALTGAHAQTVEPIYPSLTMPSHASISTGTTSGTHGIYTNTLFDPQRVLAWAGGESKEWQLEARKLRAPSLWDVARLAEVRTALLRWPTTVGAGADWLIPEVFSWDETTRVSTPSLIRLLTASPHFKAPLNRAELDDLALTAAEHLLQNEHPGLMMIHLTELDHVTHEAGRYTSQAAEAALRAEKRIFRLLESIDLNRDTVFIFGDHGFFNFDARLHLNAVFSKRGWLTVSNGRLTNWQVIAHTNCGMAAIYLRSVNKRLAAEVLSVLHELSRGTFNIVSRQELDGYNALPGALCAVDAEKGFSMGQKLEGPLIERLDHVQGEHGYLPRHHEMSTAFFAVGAGITRGRDLGHIHLTDIAPTAAAILGAELPTARGRRLSLF